MFSPTIANSHVNLAVIRHEGSNGYGYSVSDLPANRRGLSIASLISGQDHDATPRDLIVHETMKQLVEDLHDLRARCSTLETANAELHANMSALEASHASNTPGFPVVNGNGHRDLTGYASSETSSVGESMLSQSSSELCKLT